MQDRALRLAGCREPSDDGDTTFSMKNGERAARARIALHAWSETPGQSRRFVIDEDTITSIYDLMCDLAHLADFVALDSRSGWDGPRNAGGRCLEMAEYHYAAEISGDD